MKNITILLFASCVCLNSFGQIWSNAITGSDPGQLNPFTAGDVLVSDITVSGIGHGTGVSGANGDNRYNANGWNSTLLDENDYFSFTLSPAAGKKINFLSFVYTGQSSPSGPVSFAFRSSLDNFTTDIGSPTATGATIDLSNFQNITSPITFRLYAFGGTSGAGTFSVNSFEFNGSVILPVSFGPVIAFVKNDELQIQWTTLKETNNSHFEIEASHDGVNFATIKTAQSHNGNTNTRQNYEAVVSVSDVAITLAIPAILGLLSLGVNRRSRMVAVCIAIILGSSQFMACSKSEAIIETSNTEKIFIRIKQVDVDGKFSYSKVVQAIRQ